MPTHRASVRARRCPASARHVWNTRSIYHDQLISTHDADAVRHHHASSRRRTCFAVQSSPTRLCNVSSQKNLMNHAFASLSTSQKDPDQRKSSTGPCYYTVHKKEHIDVLQNTGCGAEVIELVSSRVQMCLSKIWCVILYPVSDITSFS